MSDIDKIIKINKMSAHLKAHGFAATSDDAATQAQDVYKQKIADAEKPKAQKTEEGAEKMSNEDIEKIKRNLDVFKSATQQELGAIKENVSNVISKMNEIVKAINELEKLKDSVTTIDEGGEKQQRLAPKVVKKPAEEKPKNHPRSGSSQPGDIDLNKTFYYGNK